MLILSIFNSPIVLSAVGDVTLTNWDDVASGLNDGTSGNIAFKSMGTADYFETSTDNDLSPPNSFKVSSYFQTSFKEGSGYWNLTSNFEYISNINFSFYATADVGTNAHYVQIRFYDSSANNVIGIKFDSLTDAILWNDVSTGWQVVYGVCLDTRLYVVIEHNGTNQFNIKILDSAFAVLANADHAGIYAGVYSNFSYMYVSSHYPGSGTNDRDLFCYFDDIKINIQGGEGGESELYGYTSIGYDDSDIDLISETNSKILETQCAIDFNAHIKAIDLHIGNLYIDNFGVTKDNLFLKLNGIPKGSASSLTEATGGYIVRWLFATTQYIDNEKILCEFYTDSYTWFVAWSNSDIDNDGDIWFYNHNQIAYYDGYYSKIGGVNRDLCYKIWGIFEAITPIYEDALFLSDSTINIYESVGVTVLVSTKEYQNYLNIYNSTYVLLEQYVIDGWSYYISYTPENAEIHYFNLTRNSIVKASKSLTVNAKNYTYLLFTVPNPSRRNTPFDIKYIYNNTQYNGILFIYTSDMEIVDSFFISKNTSELTTISYSLSNDGIYIMRLSIYINISEYETRYTYNHMVQSTSYENVLRAGGDTINVGDEMMLYGSHNFLFGDIYVKISDDALIYIGDTNVFSFDYVPLTPRIYICELLLKVSNNQEVILDSVTFTALGDIPIVPEPSFFGLPMTYMYAMFGAFITLGFLIIPFAMSRSHKGDTSSVIYAIFGGIGLGVSTIIGFFPLWLPLMITIIVVTILVIEYKKG